MSLIEPSKVFKPFKYPWAYEFWERQQKIHWLALEVPMAQDVQDYNNLDPRMRSLVENIFRMFVQADIDVANCYHKIYQRIFKPTEVSMMLTAFSNTETIHIQAYSHLLDTLGLPDSEYHAFLEYEQMKAKHDFLHSFDPQNPTEVALSLAGVSGFGEGLQLFASFAMLLNFPRQNLLKGMGQIVSWSVRDESLHCEGIMRLFHAYLAEQDGIDRVALGRRINEIAEQAVVMEDAFIDLAFVGGPVPGLTAEEMKAYVRYMANIRLRQLGQSDLYDVVRNPIPWVDAQQSAIEHANFFEAQATEYSKAATKGDWGDAFS
jgi:ribonucleoside-diphosphate reductase beta chain